MRLYEFIQISHLFTKMWNSYEASDLNPETELPSQPGPSPERCQRTGWGCCHRPPPPQRPPDLLRSHSSPPVPWSPPEETPTPLLQCKIMTNAQSQMLKYYKVQPNPLSSSLYPSATLTQGFPHQTEVMPILSWSRERSGICSINMDSLLLRLSERR